MCVLNQCALEACVEFWFWEGGWCVVVVVWLLDLGVGMWSWVVVCGLCWSFSLGCSLWWFGVWGVGAVVVLGLRSALSLEDLPGNWSLRLASCVTFFCDLNLWV